MDQDSFRQLLHKPSSTSSPSATSSSHVRGSLLAAATATKKKQKTVDASQPAFKPRTLKKAAKGESYRDRATERRLGVNNDYAQVEALAEDFERRNAEIEDRHVVEEQRQYLGGDSEHTVLVKGLDFALLEQNRARLAAETSATDDVSLEQAFLESSAQAKKRTREDILRELKSKRGASGTDGESPAPSATDKALEEAKKAGKFKPIGTGEVEENDERKKKRKVAVHAGAEPSASSSASTADATPADPEPVDEDFDIFAGAGEYTGIDLGDDDDDGSDQEAPSHPSRQLKQEDEEGEIRASRPSRPGKWLTTSDDEREPTPPPPAPDRQSATRSMSPQRRASLHGPPPPDGEEDGEMEEERPVRLQPLASSALPSIKDLIAMSEEAEKEEKRRLRKEKKKAGGGAGGGGGPSEKDTKAKVDRDYQRLKAYTDKKSKA
ncbi:RED-like protein N-terminal region-domain-containing protein [Daedaleopsis nitida]|nr:RED-like protein N-terminal region-domain-containing protein [Daedaleopsis nitida]